MKDIFCHCKQCRKMKKKGKALGAQWVGGFVYGGLLKVSNYVTYHRYRKGRRPDAPDEFYS